MGGERWLVIAKQQIVDYWAPQENFEEKAKARKLGREDEARSNLTVRKVGDNPSAHLFCIQQIFTQLKQESSISYYQSILKDLYMQEANRPKSNEPGLFLARSPTRPENYKRKMAKLRILLVHISICCRALIILFYYFF